MKNQLIKFLPLLVVPCFLATSLSTHKVDNARAEVVVSKGDMVRLPTFSFGKDATSTMTFTWNTTNFTNSVVEVVPYGMEFTETNIIRYTGSIEASKASSDDGYIHRVIATGLTPDTKYSYRIGDPSFHTAEVGTFKTSSTENKNFSFMHISDPQGTEQSHYISYNNLLTTATSNFDYDFIALSGDIVNNSWKDHSPVLQQWEWALTDQYSILKDYPLVTVSGNHEAASYDFSSRFTYESEDSSKESGIYYSFVYEGAYFLCLNTNDALDSEPGSSLSEEQLTFIENDLEAHKDAKWKIVILHKGLFDAGAHASNLAEGKDYDIEYFRKDLAPLFSEYKVDLVLQGHDHLYSKSYPISSTLVEGEVTHTPLVDISKEHNDGIEYVYHPGAPIYLNSGSASGSKYYAPNSSSEMSLLIEDAHNPMEKLFTNIEIDQTNNRLVYKTYIQKKDTYELYRSYGINKGEHFVNDDPSSEPITPPSDTPTTMDLTVLWIVLGCIGGVVIVGTIITTLIIKLGKKAKK